MATINAVDFLYTCPGHLSDPGFATLVGTGDVPKVAISAEEIAKVKAEWEEKEKKRKEKEKAKEKEGKEKGEEKEKAKDSDNKAGDKEKEGSKSPKVPATPTTPPLPAHERYTLHRDFFSSEYKESRAVHKMELTFRTSASR